MTATVTDHAGTDELPYLRARIISCLASLRGARAATWRSPNGTTLRVEEKLEAELDRLIDMLPRTGAH